MISWSRQILNLWLLIFFFWSIPPPSPFLFLKLAFHLSHWSFKEPFTRKVIHHHAVYRIWTINCNRTSKSSSYPCVDKVYYEIYHRHYKSTHWYIHQGIYHFHIRVIESFRLFRVIYSCKGNCSFHIFLFY
jgi:hypothetical protein